jgi:hypothetical protein
MRGLSVHNLLALHNVSSIKQASLRTGFLPLSQLYPVQPDPDEQLYCSDACQIHTKHVNGAAVMKAQSPFPGRVRDDSRVSKEGLPTASRPSHGTGRSPSRNGTRRHGTRSPCGDIRRFELWVTILLILALNGKKMPLSFRLNENSLPSAPMRV